jgi:hypothetical protein
MTRPKTVLELALAPHRRREKDESALCDQFVRRQGGDVVRTSQSQKPVGMTLGIPDSRYRVAGVAFSWEAKVAPRKLTPEQKDYLEAELRYGEACGCGDLEDLEAFVGALRRLPEGTREPGRWLSRDRRELALTLAPALIEKWRHNPRPAARGKLRRRAR